jgi:peptidase M15-like protein
VRTRTRNEDDAVRVLVRPGDRSFYVRQAKVATVRFLKAKRPQSTGPLRRQLWRQRRGERFGEVMERAVKLVQQIADLPQSGEITFSVDAELAGYWPRDGRARRILRSTPAWQTIPGQLSPNFNLRELACHDGTGYVDGLVRECGLTPAQAAGRAGELARRLERLRELRNGRPVKVTSAYRSRAYNQSVGGESNSAHLRGYAADTPPADAQPLVEHQAHVRQAFECGVGVYPSQQFVHGDFDHALGRREWSTP